MLRRYAFKLYPNAAQLAALDEQRRLHALLWNALLQQRIEAYSRRRFQRPTVPTKELTKFDQCRGISALRRECPEFMRLSVASIEAMAGTVDDAFERYFSRMADLKSRPAERQALAERFKARKGRYPKSEELYGHPRFRRLDEHDYIPLREMKKTGWKFTETADAQPDVAQKVKRAPSNLASFSVPCGESRCGVTGNGVEPQAGCPWLRCKVRCGVTGNGVEPQAIETALDQLRCCGVTGNGVEPQVAMPVGCCGVTGNGVESPELTHRRKTWRLYLFGCPGKIKARGTFPAKPLDIRNATITLRDGVWWLSVVVRMAARRSVSDNAADLTVTFDLIDEFARVERTDGGCPAAPLPDFYSGNGGIAPCLQVALAEPPQTGGDDRRSPRFAPMVRLAEPPQTGGDDRIDSVGERVTLLAEPPQTGYDDRRIWAVLPALEARKDFIQSERDRRFVKWSYRWKRETKRITKLAARIARIRKYYLHNWTTAVVGQAKSLSIIAPPMRESTVSGRGHAGDYGAMVSDIAKINRGLLGQAPASAVQMLEYKAAETGISCDIIKARKSTAATISRDISFTAKAAAKTRRAK